MTEPPILTRHRQPVETSESESGTYDSLSEPARIANKGSERNKEKERAKARGSAWETEFGVPDKVGFKRLFLSVALSPVSPGDHVVHFYRSIGRLKNPTSQSNMIEVPRLSKRKKEPNGLWHYQDIIYGLRLTMQ